MSNIIQVRHAAPVYSALQWPALKPGNIVPSVPGVKQCGDEYYVTTRHRQLVKLGAGMWLVWNDDGHILPSSDAQFRRCYERVDGIRGQHQL